MFKKGKKLLSTILSLSVFTSLFMGATLITKAEPVNIALNKTATSSSNIAGSTASLAFDGNSNTRWESDWSDPQWISVDLGTSYNVTGVKLNWETAAAKDYKIQVSNDNSSWVDAYTKTGGTGGTETLTFGASVTGRYVRMYGTARTTQYGYSLWDFEVYGTAVTQSSNIALNKTATASSILGGNTASLAFDSDNAGTRWESAFSDPQWISVDLGSTYTVTGAKLIWETAAAKDYKIQVSNDNSNWVDAYTKTGGTGGTETLTFGASVTGRYVRMYGTSRTTQYGYSLWGFEVYGTASVANKVSTPAITPSNGSYTSAQSVTISDSTSGSTIRYTTDGTNPSATNGTIYSGAFTVSQTTSVKAIAYKSGMTDSDIATSYITIGSSSNVDFGPNVKIFDPSMSSASIQSTVDTIFNQMQSNQFGSERYALLFKPGSYNANVNVGFYTTVYGLGQMPDDVSITGAVRCEADWMNGNATCNFWRSVENLSVSPTYVSNNLTTAETLTWAVSQAAPMRRVHIKGGLSLWDPYGTNYDGAWSSGGFISDSKVDGTISSGSQQQFLTRNSQMGSWNGGNWNMVFVGNNGAPTNDSSFPSVPNTVVNQTPVVREKPFLTIDSNGKYSVFVPALKSNSQGISWANGMGQGTSMSIDQFYIARSDRDTAASINAALNQGKNLIFTPGVYHLSDSIKVNNPNTVILGLGLATLIPDNGTAAMTVADVDGVNISGLLFDAGQNNSPTLLEVGPTGSTQNHAANPTSLSDLFFRVGGAAVGKADVSLKINSNNVIGDNFWVWRADHGVDGVGWTINTTKNGVVVNGNDVTIYGLFVEHFHEYQTLWNGNGGRVYFYQSEMPYDVPNQASWMSHNGTVNGYASYKVADNVTTHQLYGSGIYSYFRDAVVSANTGIEVPTTSGVKVHHACSVYLTGNGEITHVVNNTGAAAKAGSTRQTVTDY